MDNLTWLALALIFLVIVLVVYMIVVLHMLPGKIARKNKHPQLKAIETCSLMGLIIFPFWMVAMVWANFRPPALLTPAMADANERGDSESARTDSRNEPGTGSEPASGKTEKNPVT